MVLRAFIQRGTSTATKIKNECYLNFFEFFLNGDNDQETDTNLPDMTSKFT